MKTLALAILCLLLVQAETARRHFLISFTPVNLDLARLTPDQQAGLRAHAENLQRLYQSGSIVTGGRTTDPDDLVGLAVVEVADEAEARAMAASDPGVKGGFLTAKVQPFLLAFPPRGK